MKELDVVELVDDLPENGLKAGETGTIVHEHTKPRHAYMVEFIDSDGITTAMVTLLPDQVRLHWSA